MNSFEHDSPALGRIHNKSNASKLACHFTGFLEGVAASGMLEVGEIEPLLDECRTFVAKVVDGDAEDLIADFDADLMDHDSIVQVAEMRLRDMDPDCQKSAVNRFLGYCRGIACDNRITSGEAQGIIEQVGARDELLAVPGVREIYLTCVDAVQDEIVTSEESEEICEAIARVVGDSYADTGLSQVFGVANFDEHKIGRFPADLNGQRIVFTGNFQTSPRRLLEEALADFGVIIGKSVTGKTDYLIVGGECSRDWIELNRGLKLRKALELRQTNSSPRFISEAQLIRLMKA